MLAWWCVGGRLVATLLGRRFSRSAWIVLVGAAPQRLEGILVTSAWQSAWVSLAARAPNTLQRMSHRVSGVLGVMYATRRGTSEPDNGPRAVANNAPSRPRLRAPYVKYPLHFFSIVLALVLSACTVAPTQP